MNKLEQSLNAVDVAFEDAVKTSLMRRDSMQSVNVSGQLLTYTLRSLMDSVLAIDVVVGEDQEIGH